MSLKPARRRIVEARLSSVPRTSGTTAWESGDDVGGGAELEAAGGSPPVLVGSPSGPGPAGAVASVGGGAAVGTEATDTTGDGLVAAGPAAAAVFGTAAGAVTGDVVRPPRSPSPRPRPAARAHDPAPTSTAAATPAATRTPARADRVRGCSPTGGDDCAASCAAADCPGGGCPTDGRAAGGTAGPATAVRVYSDSSLSSCSWPATYAGDAAVGESRVAGSSSSSGGCREATTTVASGSAGVPPSGGPAASKAWPCRFFPSASAARSSRRAVSAVAGRSEGCLASR